MLYQAYSSSSATNAQAEHEDFPADHETKWQWLLEHSRTVKPRERLRIKHPWKDKLVSLYHISQTQPASPYDLALRTYLQLFWRPFKQQGKYLAGNTDPYTYSGSLPRSRVVQALHGKGFVGVFGHPGRRTSFVATDFDCHVNTGGNRELFLLQCHAVLGPLWGLDESQVVLAPGRIRGIHLIHYFLDHLPRLEEAVQVVRNQLRRIHNAHPEIARLVDEHNARQPRGKRMKHICELEVYPDANNGFRVLGHGAKDVIAHEVIGYEVYDTYKKGARKGEDKKRFNLIKWTDSFGKPRMPFEQVMALIEKRLEPDCISEEIPAGTRPATAHETTREPARKPVPLPTLPAPKSKSYYRCTREKIVSYFTGQDCPPGILLERAAVWTRACQAFGCSSEEMIDLLHEQIRHLPPEASSKILNDQWGKLERELARMVNNIYAKGCQPDASRSQQEWDITKQAWESYGFDPRDLGTWKNEPGTQKKRGLNKIPVWKWQDEQDIGQYLAPVLKVSRDVAVQVATQVVLLVQDKEKEGNGFGYEFLKIWLLDNFGIKCGNRNKTHKIFQALQELGLIEIRIRHITKRRSTGWGLGERSQHAVGVSLQ